MGNPATTKTARGRPWLRTSGRVLFGCAACALLALAVIWLARRPIAVRVMRPLLAQYGFSDVSFRLSRLSPGCVVVEDLRIGDPEQALSVDWAEVRFSWPELARGGLERVRVRGVVLPAQMEGTRPRVPLLERLQALSPTASGRADERPSDEKQITLSVGELSVYDLRIPVRLADGSGLVTLAIDAGAVLEPCDTGAWERYRLWADASDGEGTRVEVAGSLLPAEGALALTPVVRVAHVERWFERAVRVAPDWRSRLTAWPTNASAVVRGSVSVSDWKRVDAFDVAAELGRGSRLDLAKPAGWLKLQTLRVEAAGKPSDVQARFSAGVAGFRFEGQGDPVSQEEGRLMSMRGTARFSQTPTNRLVSAVIDSDMPGRSAAKVLPQIFPLLPRLLTEGGTVHAEAALSAADGGTWQGDVRVAAEARRNTLTVPAGRLGASRVAIEGRLAVRDATPGTLLTDVSIEEGYFFGQGVPLRGSARLSLVFQPPYQTAAGTFSGSLAETSAFRKFGVALRDETLRFGGNASVSGVLSSPAWQVSLDVPEIGVAGAQDGAWQATVGASARVEYAATRLEADGAVWARDASLSVTGGTERVVAGLSKATVRFKVSGRGPSDPQSLRAESVVSVQGGYARAGKRLALEEADAEVPVSWTPAAGVLFGERPRLSWKRLEAAGLRVQPGVLGLAAADGAARGTFDVSLEGSSLRACASARVPFSRPGDLTVDLVVPDAQVGSDDAVAGAVQAQSGLTFSGRVGGEAKIRLLGSQPLVLGCARLADGRIGNAKLSVDGLSANVPFESGLFFRTIERPRLTFNAIKAGQIQLGAGAVSFQLTPEEAYVDRLEVAWCKGSLNAYSVHVPYARPKTDFVVYADRIDLGEALMMVMPVKGLVEGVLYGRIPVGFENGRVRLATGFLYSLPGQGGKLRLDDSAQMAGLLEKAGIKGDVQAPLSRALSNVDFSAVKMELEPGAGKDGVLRIKLNGKSNDKAWPAPVDLNLNVHAPLDELVNMGLDLSR